MSNGHVYIQNKADLLEVRGKQITYVCTIPNFKYNSSKILGQLFVVNDQLFYSDFQNIYQIANEQFKLIKNTLSGSLFTSFCGRSFCISKFQVTEIRQKLQERIVFESHDEIVPVLVQGGIIIFQTHNKQKHFALSLLNRTFVVQLHELFSPTLTRYGLSLSDLQFEQIFGKQQSVTRQQVFDEWMLKQKSCQEYAKDE